MKRGKNSNSTIIPSKMAWTLAKLGRQIKQTDPTKAEIVFMAANIVAQERRAG